MSDFLKQKLPKVAFFQSMGMIRDKGGAGRPVVFFSTNLFAIWVAVSLHLQRCFRNIPLLLTSKKEK